MWEIQARCLSKSKRMAATAVGTINLSPYQIWELLTLPEGADIFRVEGRKHGADDGCGRWDEQVVFTAAVRVLFWKTLARTRVHQDIDASDPECLRVNFRLLQSDLMSHLTGQWELQQLAAAGPNSPPTTRVTYCFEMWPKGVPSGLRFMPGLMEAVKGAVRREAAQLLDKVHFVACRVRPGVSMKEALQQVSAACNASGGSFKLLQQALTTSSSSSSSAASSSSGNGIGSAAAAAAAADAANAVQCHALVDDFEAESDDAEEDGMLDLGSDCYSDADGESDSSVAAELSSSTATASSSSSGSFMECEDAHAGDDNTSSGVITPVRNTSDTPGSPSKSGRESTASGSSAYADASVEVKERPDAAPRACVDVEKLASKLNGLQQGAAAAADAAQQRVSVMA